MSEQLSVAISNVLERLVAIAVEDAQFRSTLRHLAQIVLEETNTAESQGETAAPIDMLEPGVDEVTEEPVQPHVPLPELTLGQTADSPTTPVISLPAGYSAPAEVDLSLVASRCRLKAEGARFAATRRQLMSEGAEYSTEIEPRYRELIARAKAIPECFLWMCHPNGPSPADLRLYEDIAGCFDAVAYAVSTLRQVLDEPDLHQGEFERLLDVLAEAQSALRVAIAAIDGPIDADQDLVFKWLKRTTNENQIFIQRYMRIDDPADPANLEDLSARIEQVNCRVRETERIAERRRKLLGSVRRKAASIADIAVSGEWPYLTETVDELIREGLPPSNRELRELLLPIIDNLPDEAEIPEGVQLVLREIDRFLATSPPPQNAPVIQRSAEATEVARLLNGRSLVLIGGERRPAAQQALKDAFGLQEVYWLAVREHQSIDSFQPYVAKPDVAVVLLAIRWSSHSFSEVRVFCDQHQKPLVRLPGGYNPNQVAAQIMAQASERLTEE